MSTMISATYNPATQKVVPKDAVVLDIPDPERLVEVLRGTDSFVADHAANQIEAQTRRPKPDEPIGLGAVVKDAAGQLWIRASKSGQDAWRREGPGVYDHTWHFYSDLDVVRVLAEGWSQ